MFEYDDQAAVQFIGRQLPPELREQFPEDTLYYLLDLICDFYEQRDWLSDDDEEREEAQLIQYLHRHSAADGIGRFTPDHLRLVLAAEAAYADTLDIPE